MKFRLFLSLLLLTACTSEIKPLPNKAAIYGTVTAASHPLYTQKQESNGGSSSVYSESNPSVIKYADNMVDYSALNDIYVSIILPKTSPREHQVIITDSGITPSSLALAVGDSLVIDNQSHRIQSLFIAQAPESGVAIQSFPPLSAGTKQSVKLKLEGNLELLSEDNDALKAMLFSQKNLQAQRVASGGQYIFNDLDEGSYTLVFWYWRLGKLYQTVTVHRGESIEVDKLLTVDSVVHAHN